jgi:hypothetical protein
MRGAPQPKARRSGGALIEPASRHAGVLGGGRSSLGLGLDTFLLDVRLRGRRLNMADIDFAVSGFVGLAVALLCIRRLWTRTSVSCARGGWRSRRGFAMRDELLVAGSAGPWRCVGRQPASPMRPMIGDKAAKGRAGAEQHPKPQQGSSRRRQRAFANHGRRRSMRSRRRLHRAPLTTLSDRTIDQ